MNFEEKVKAFFLRFSYSQKLSMIVFLTFFISIITVLALNYCCHGLYRSTLIDKETAPFQENILKISNQISLYHVELLHKRLMGDKTDSAVLEAIEKQVDSDIAQFLSAIHNYSLTEHSTVILAEIKAHITEFREFERQWNAYKSAHADTPLNIQKERFKQLIEIMDKLQSRLKSTFNLFLNDDEGTKRLIDVNYIALPRLTLQIPILYSSLSEQQSVNSSSENEKKESMASEKMTPGTPNVDFYGALLIMDRNMIRIKAALQGISGLIDEALQANTKDLFEEVLESLTNVNKELKASAVSGQHELLYEESKKALQTYSQIQSKVGALLYHLYDRQHSTIAFRLYLGYIFVGIAVFLILVTYFARIITQPLKDLTDAANDLAVGKVNVRIPIHQMDEVGEMSEAFNALAKFLEDKLKEIKDVAKKLLESVQAIFDVARKLEENIAVQDRELVVIKGHIKEITIVVKEFSLHLNNVYKSISATTGVADVGRKSLTDMEHVMQQMVGASESIVSSLNSLNIKICSINDVINTIVKIADQINLLSLNTAIQANKAGPEGWGFTIIAKKIRELSGQTAYSTLDIEGTVQNIVSSVDISVNEVNKFLEQVLLQVKDSTLLSEEFKKLIHYFQHQVEVFKSVNEDMTKQAESATELQEVLRTLSNASKRTTTAVSQFYEEIQSLDQSTNSLIEKIDSFTHPSYVQTQLAVGKDESSSNI